MGRGDQQGQMALSAGDMESFVPGPDWPLAGTHRGHAEVADLLWRILSFVNEAELPVEGSFSAL
jgi:hypothetical protein